jgi:uncharacterized protein (TIGR02001 family)
MMTNELVKRLKVFSVAAVAGISLLGGSMGVQAAELGVETSIDFMSKYVCRGGVLTDEPVIQPSVTLSYGDFSFNVWGSIDTTAINEDNDDTYNLQEVDYTLSYAFAPSEALEMEVGVIAYVCPGTTCDTTSEVFMTATLATMPLTPSLTVYYDFDEFESGYANLSIGHSFALTEKLGLSLGAAVGYGDTTPEVTMLSTGKLNDMSVSASLDYAVNDNFSISGSLAYTERLADGDDDTDEIIGGLNLTFAY